MKIHGEFAQAVEAAGAKILEGGRWSGPRRDDDHAGLGQPVRDAGRHGRAVHRDQGGPRWLLPDPARDLDQALELANMCPSGNIEVRPVMDTGGDGA